MAIDFHPHADPCHRCHATAWELFGVFRPSRGPLEDVIECAFCGLRSRVPHVEMPRCEAKPQAAANEFRFQSGRFSGMTLAEADAQPNGRRYLEVVSKSDSSLRETIGEYLEKNSA
jgi:hypothetical protein